MKRLVYATKEIGCVKSFTSCTISTSCWDGYRTKWSILKVSAGVNQSIEVPTCCCQLTKHKIRFANVGRWHGGMVGLGIWKIWGPTKWKSAWVNPLLLFLLCVRYFVSILSLSWALEREEGGSREESCMLCGRKLSSKFICVAKWTPETRLLRQNLCKEHQIYPCHPIPRTFSEAVVPQWMSLL